jgi:hypothetical protein
MADFGKSAATTTTGHSSSLEGQGGAEDSEVSQERVGELVDMLAKTVDRMEELLSLMKERGLDTEPLAKTLPKRGGGRKGRK